MNKSRSSGKLVPFILGRVLIPRGWVSSDTLASWESELTVERRWFDPDSQKWMSETIHLLRMDQILVEVPYAWAVKKGIMNQWEFNDFRTEGISITVPREPDPFHARVKEPQKQKELMDEMIASALNVNRFVVEADTGIGKTICALKVVSALKRKTLILVHLERLKKQWVEEIHDKLGIHLERIKEWPGTKKEDFSDCDVIVALIQTVSRRIHEKKIPDCLIRDVGVVVFDELHRIPTKSYIDCLGYFPAKYQFGMTATMKRPDNTHEVYLQDLGLQYISSSAKSMGMKLWVLKFQHNGPIYGKQEGGMAKMLSFNKRRNKLLVSIVTTCYNNKRNTLVVSGIVRHLEDLMKLCEENGIPREKMGQFTAQRSDGSKIKGEELKEVLKTKQIIFATYGMIKEGIDIPRIDAGVDATPKAHYTQLLGRARRYMEFKSNPVWYTIQDLCISSCPNAKRLDLYFKSRMREASKISGIEVKEHHAIYR